MVKRPYIALSFEALRSLFVASRGDILVLETIHEELSNRKKNRRIGLFKDELHNTISIITSNQSEKIEDAKIQFAGLPTEFLCNKKEEGLHDCLSQILIELERQSIIQREFSDFAKFIPGYEGGLELNKDDLEYLSEKFEHYKISSQPRVKRGFIKRGIDASIYLYKNQGDFDHESENYRYAQTVLRVAVIMARVDGVVSEEEVEGVTKILKKQKFLSERETIALDAHAHFLLQASIGVGGGEQTRSYLKEGISKEHVVDKIESMSRSAQQKFLQVAKDIAIADGVLDKREVLFLQDIYRALDMPARSAQTDIEKYAQERHVDLELNIDKDIYSDTNAMEEVGDILGELLMDFDKVSEFRA